jgi:superfamily II DNA or RNA helicase|tara:strand:+ start:1865 stop:3157 length:1293 start_codon:yes stop_codon:yes gene_type:complete
MDKAVISNRIYMTADAKRQKLLDLELTYKIPSYNPTEPPQIIKNMGRINNELVTVPVGRFDLIPEGHEIIDKRTLVPEIFPEFKFELRDSQSKVFNSIDDNAIINAFVSWGKTFTALAVAAKLGQKTLIVVHTLALRNQWEEEIEKCLGIKAGIIGSGRFDTDPIIVVANVQTLSKKIKEISKMFGTIILDEMHHVSAPTFSGIIDRCSARYKIGLSGTLQRKDGKHVIFNDYFGFDVHQPPKENYITPRVIIVKTEIRFPDSSKIPWAKRVNAVAYDENYQKIVAQLASVYAAKGHKVLVVSDRVQLLKRCSDLTGDNATCITGELDQGTRDTEIAKIKTGELDVLYGSQSIFGEGISVNELSALVLATPINNEPLLIQLIGRIIRKQEGKLQPVVIDIHLKGNTASRQARARSAVYIKQGYDIKVVAN